MMKFNALKKTCAGFILAQLSFIPTSALLAADYFWQGPQSQSQTISAEQSLIGANDLTASLFTSRQLDIGGLQVDQSAITLTQSLTETSSLAFEYAQAANQRNVVLGYTNNNLSLSFMNGSGEDYARLGGDHAGLDPYLFHAGYKQDFNSQGYALDYGFGRLGHLQFGQATVAADGLQNRRARYMEWSNNKIFARSTRFARAGEHIGNGLDLGFAFGSRGNKLLALQTMQLDNNRSMQRLRLQFNGRQSRQYWVDFSSHQNPLFAANDDHRVMFSFKTLLGTRSLASYQNDGGSSSTGDIQDGEGIEDENGDSSKAKKTGRGWKRAVFIGAGVAAAAGLSSSGSSSQDTNLRFRTQNEAAFDVLNNINPVSIRENKEYGGWVFINPDGGFASTNPVQGEAASVQLPSRNQVIPSGSRSTATYHTHAAFDPRFDNENFSPTDLESDRTANVDGYLATPGGQFKFHDLSTGEIITLGPIDTI